MSVLLEQVSVNIRQARQRLGLSQQELADRADLSRRMITLIENALGNASLTTLDRIAQALDMPFADLVRPPRLNDDANTKPIKTWQGQHAKSQANLLQSASAERWVELWEWSLAPSERYQAEPDPHGMREFVFVISGILTLELAGTAQSILAGESFSFPSDQDYAYVNQGNTLLRFIKNVIS